MGLPAAEVPLPAVADPPGRVVGALWRLVAPVGAVRGEVAVCGCRNAPGVRGHDANMQNNYICNVLDISECMCLQRS